MENNFKEQTDLVINELSIVAETYDPLLISQQTLEDIARWVGMVSQAQIERLRDIIGSTKG